MGQIGILASVIVITVTGLPILAFAWNIPGHMLSAAIAYQVLQQERPQTIDQVKSRAGETSLVREPMAGQTSGRAR
jgi:hypothetical protein